MDLDQTLRLAKPGSYQKTCNIQANLHRKKDNDRQDLSKRQIQEAQSHFLFFSALQFKKNQFFLKLRLLEKIRKILIFRKRKNRSRMIQHLKAMNEALEILKEHRNKQAEEGFPTPAAKPITLLKDLMQIPKETHLTSLKKQSKFHH